MLAKNGQPPISLKDIAGYENIIKTSNTREIKDNKIIYKKQVDGYYVVVEEVLTGQNKLEFKTMYKENGHITPSLTPSN